MPRKILLVLSMLLAFSLLLVSQLNLVQAYPLEMTVATDKSIYNVGEVVHISGNLTFYAAPVSGELVALQINDRTVPYVFRTLYTGTPPSGPWDAEITSAYIGDYEGNPLTNVQKGSVIYIWIFYQNNYWENINITIAYTIYDVNQAPLFAQMPISESIPPGTGYFVRCPWQVPTNIASGPATLYANAFTALPMNEGTPYCTEKSSTFNIAQTEGNFATQLRIHPNNARLGSYAVYVASFHFGYYAYQSTTFTVELFGDVNGDGYVNAKDATMLGAAFGSSPGDGNWNPDADLNDDGIVNAKDAIIIGSNFGHSGL